MRGWIQAALTLAIGIFVSSAFSETPVASCSRTEPSGERTLCQEAVIAAPADEVWRLFATSEGLRSWAAPVAQIDARTGGEWEASYNPTGHIGDHGNIRNRIVAVEPNRLLVMQVAAAPPGFQHEAEVRQVTSVIELAPVDDGHTNVRISMIGYRDGPGFDAVYRFFEWGNAYSLQKLEQRVTQGPIDWARDGEQQDATPER